MVVTQKAIDVIAARYWRYATNANETSGDEHNLWLARTIATVDTFADCMGISWIAAEQMLRQRGEE